jgi:hypothetical protein
MKMLVEQLMFEDPVLEKARITHRVADPKTAIGGSPEGTDCGVKQMWTPRRLIVLKRHAIEAKESIGRTEP